MADSDDAQARACKIRRLTKSVAQLIVDSRAYFDAEARCGWRDDVTKPLKRTAACLEVSETLVKKACRLGREGEDLPSDTEKEIREWKRSVPEAFFEDIRVCIFAMYTDKKRVTLDTLLSELQGRRSTRCTAWVWSRTTLHRVLTEDMAFSYGQRPTHYKSLREKQSIALQRLRYIKQVRWFRAEGRQLFYQDETWVTKNMTPSNVWLDETGNGGMKVPSGKDMRSIVAHVGSESGFVDGAALIFRGKKALAESDYHSEMNSAVFLDWLEKKVLPIISPRSVLVVDRATYHTTLTKESQPAKAVVKKEELVEWLLAYQIQSKWQDVVLSTKEDYLRLKRVELMEICTQNKPAPVFQVQELARKFDCEIVLLSVAHPELNPIELIWADIKAYAARKM